MAKADTSVKFFHADMPDAPVLRGQAGALIELLDACLVTGFSVRTPDSIVVADGVATVSISSGNPYQKHAVIAISGASNAALNDEWRIATAAASSLTFACPGVANGTVTGASIKRAPAKWEKQFSNTATAVYRPYGPYVNQLAIRVNDTDARYARVRGYEDMTDVDTGSGPFPTLAQAADENYVWAKSDFANSSSRKWAFFADSGLILFFPRFTMTYGGGAVSEFYRFGDFNSFVAGDGYGSCIAATASSSPPYPSASISTIFNLNSGSGLYLARSASQVPGAIKHMHRFPLQEVASIPQSILNKIYFFSMLLTDGLSSTDLVRGVLPGVSFALEKRIGVAAYSVEESDGRVTMFVTVGASGDEGRLVAVDIVGPWR